MESSYTEAAGLSKHLEATVNEPFSVPAISGNHTFVITNDAGESNYAPQATFMIIENVKCDRWYMDAVSGKIVDTLVFNTSWAYEFVTNSERIELRVRVSDTLDIYKARLYLMSNKKSLSVNNVSLPWELDLLAQNGLLIDGGVGGGLAAVGAVIYIKKCRE